MNHAGHHGRLIPAIWVAFAALVGACFLERHVAGRAARIKGIVTERRLDPNLLGGMSTPKTVIAYTAGGRRCRILIGNSVADRLSSGYEIGARVPLLVSPTNPLDARPDTALRVYPMTLSMALATLFLLCVRPLRAIAAFLRRRPKPGAPARRAA